MLGSLISCDHSQSQHPVDIFMIRIPLDSTSKEMSPTRKYSRGNTFRIKLFNRKLEESLLALHSIIEQTAYSVLQNTSEMIHLLLRIRPKLIN